MRLLLDTCVAFWVFEGSDRISPALRDKICDPNNEIFFSQVSLLEIVIKYNIGKLELPRPPSRLILPLAEKHGFEMLPIMNGAILHLEKLPMHHRDPFDRLLLAQAIDSESMLISPDPLLHRYKEGVYWE